VQSPNPHRILLVVSHLGTAGAEKQSAHLARGLAARGHAVTVVALGHVRAPTEPLRAAGVRVLRLGAVGPRARTRALPALVRLARRTDVVHCTNWDASFYGRIAALAAGRPVVVADHSGDRAVNVSRRGAPRGRWVAAHHRVLAPLTSATVTCAQSQEKVLLSEGVPRRRLACIPNGVPIAELRAAAGDDVSRTALGLPGSSRVVMHVAMFRAEKNQEQTLATVAELRRRIGDVRAVFVGSGPLESQVRGLAGEMGADWAVFLGQRNDVPALLAMADVLVLPSRSEALPMAILEAQALGVPVVAFDVGDVRSVLEATGGGLCVPRLDGGAFTAACARVLGDAALRADLSRRGLAGSAGFDAPEMTRRYDELLDAAVARRRRPRAVRVAHVGPDIQGRGGIPAVLRDLLASPLAKRYDLEFISTYGSATYGEVDRRRRATRFARGLLRLAAWCAAPGPRLVHVHAATRGSWYRKSLCVAVAHALRRPVILHLHAGSSDVAAFCERIGPVRRRLFSRAFRAADRVVSVSAASAHEVERHLGVTGIAILPNAPPVVSGEASSRIDGTGRGVSVVYLGGFANPAKGGAVLVEALPAILDAVPGVSVSLAGLGPPPALDGLGPHVHWLGWLQPAHAADALARADIVVLPSVSEGLPVALLEAMAHGAAIVATRVGGVPEVITDDVEGVLVPLGDPTALARSIGELATDPVRRRRLAVASRARAVRLRRDEVYEPLEKLYRELAAGAPGR
jgi:glycosyltransferase involved in cell wall biosynthesis